MATAATGSALASDKVVETHQGDSAHLSLSEYFSVLEDPGRELTLTDVQKADLSPGFKGELPAQEALNFGYTRSAYWLRLTLRNPEDQALTRLLEIRYSGLSSVQFHTSMADGTHHSVVTGSVEPFSSRAYAHRFFVFPIALAAHTQKTFYLRVQSNGPITVPVYLWTDDAFHSSERADYAIQTWYFGIATAMLLFNLLLLVALRHISYLLYMVFISCMTLTIAVQNGLAKELLWNDSPLWSNMAANTGYSLTLAALLLFMRHMLQTRVTVPKSDRWLKWLIVVFLVSPIGFAFALPTLVKPAALLYAATGVLVLSLAIHGAFKRQRSAYFFVIAFGVLAFAAVVTVLRAMGWLPTNTLTVNALQFGSGIEMLLLAFSLADRFNVLRKASERKLEERVQQRTIELDLKNTALLQAMSSLETVERIARHDLKTPLGSLAAAPALLRAARTMDAREESILRMMEHAANRALSMVNLSLDLYRMESGNYVPSPARVNLTSVLRDVVLDLGVQAQAKSVSIDMQEPLAPLCVWAEESLCYSILANLAKNAVEAAPAHACVRMTLDEDVNHQTVRLHIHNPGAVPIEIRDDFFVKNSTTGKLGGNGLGTYSSHLLARMQGGNLTMETSDASGTTLTLELPRCSTVTESTIPPAGTITAQRILVVDDDEFNRLVLISQLPQPPLEVEAAVNGREAMEAVMRERFDVIIMDIDMPIMGGLEALQRIRQYQAEAGQRPSYIVAYSGNDSTKRHAEFLANGFDRCMHKPSSQQEVLAMLTEFQTTTI